MNLFLSKPFFCFLPEICLVGLILLILILKFILPPSDKDRLFKVVLGGFFIAFLCVLILWGREPSALWKSLRLDPAALFFKGLFLFSGFFLVSIIRQYQNRLGRNVFDFCALIVTTVLGSCFLVSACDFLTFFISLELMTISLYVLTAFLKSDERSVEASVKYLIMGAFSSAVLVFGIAFLYGSTGDLSFDAIRSFLHANDRPGFFFFLGFFLILAGIGFKISSFPFQLWVPDVYEGSALPVTALLAALSKGAGFAVLMRILFDVTSAVSSVWTALISLLSCATLFYGNLGAIPQIRGNIKRLLGFSGIGHAGYLLMGLASGTSFGLQAAGYYLMTYVLGILAVFLALVCVSDENETIPSLRGLFTQSPLAGTALFLGLMSLAGVPPLAGFFAKFLVIQSAVESGMLWLAFVGAVNIAISLYYYLMVVRTVYVEKPERVVQVRLSHTVQGSLIILMGLLILLGIFQEPFMQLAGAITF